MTENIDSDTPVPAFNPVRPVDADALKQAKVLVRGARFGSIAVLEPETKEPSVSRVLTGTDSDGTPVILASMLTMHMKALLADGRCSLLLGEPGKGDPLAWPRITVSCAAAMVDRASESYVRIRARFLRRHPKARLYADFGDFHFVRLVPTRGNLNGGFGKAFHLEGDSLLMPMLSETGKDDDEVGFINSLAGVDPEAGDRVAQVIYKEKTKGWGVVGIDREGLDLAANSRILRWEFGEAVSSLEELYFLYKRELNYT